METQRIDDKMHMEYNYIIDKKHKTANNGMNDDAQHMPPKTALWRNFLTGWEGMSITGSRSVCQDAGETAGTKTGVCWTRMDVSGMLGRESTVDRNG